MVTYGCSTGTYTGCRRLNILAALSLTGLPAVPLLIPIVNLTALANGALPMHASAFTHDGVGVTSELQRLEQWDLKLPPAPFVLKHGATVAQFAERVHKDFVTGFKTARIWGTGVFEGQTVQRDHALIDGDVIEIHT